MEEYIRSSMIQGFGSALAVIYVVFWLQLRSLGLAAIAMIPNVFPILMTLGFMGFAGIRLDSMTTMVASISIGLAVDDTIHFLDRVGVHTARGLPIAEALRDATLEVGRAVTFTLVALCAGFGVMLFSTFVGAVYFGLLSLLAIVFGRAADLLLLPVLLRWYGQRRTRTPAAAGVVDGPAALGHARPQANVKAA
jgi:predicted RND superfamily exporter protein